MAFSDPELAQKLNLTDSQKTDIQQIVTASREKMPSRRGLPERPREAAMKKSEEVEQGDSPPRSKGKLQR